MWSNISFTILGPLSKKDWELVLDILVKFIVEATDKGINIEFRLFVWVFSSHSRIFHSYGDVIIAGEGLFLI